MTAPTPVNPEPTGRTRPAPAGGFDTDVALADGGVATGGFTWQELRDGYQMPPIMREAELLPVDVNPT